MKIGFEIHQQLSGSKLFCSCPSRLTEAEPEARVVRRLRPTQSELGEIDRAAMEEHLKGRHYEYELHHSNTCLVELDEEPPHRPSEEAIGTALEIALLLKARVVDELHFMRKLVIDGSNTSGFQKSAVLALDGEIDTSQGRVEVPLVCLEEEAARKVGEEGRKVAYRLDRLGIPLVEITTSPDVEGAEQAGEVARKIGDILRSTGKVRRGLGTIRQDLNISTKEGARVEIKGVQELDLIPLLVTGEAERQEMLVRVREELRRRGFKGEELEIKDLSGVFQDAGSRVIRKKLSRGGKVLGAKLPGFSGLLTRKLGPELAGYARVKAGVAGIFHSDELPGYGIKGREVEALAEVLEAGEGDAFVLVAEKESKAKRALEAIHERAHLAFEGVPEETRMAKKDGSTAYMRPLPGAARMYPETDIPPIAIPREELEEIRRKLPELIGDKIERFSRQYGLNREVAGQLARSKYAGVFEKIAKKRRDIASYSASVLLSTLKEIKREGYAVDSIASERLEKLIGDVAEGMVAKEAVPQVIRKLAENPRAGLDEIYRQLGESLGEEELRGLVRRVLNEKAELVAEQGMRAEKPLMGVVMKKVRGKASGELVNRVLRDELNKFAGKKE